MSTSSKKLELPPRILGLSGTFASGKDTIASWLNLEYGYYHVSTGDMVREVARAQYGKIERPTLLKTANKLRKERGSGVLVELAFEHFEPLKQHYPGGLVISGVRSIGEAKILQQNNGLLMFIDASVEERYRRMVARARSDEKFLSFLEFQEREKQEMSPKDNSNELIQNINAVSKMADISVFNDSEVKLFLEEIRKTLKLHEKRSS